MRATVRFGATGENADECTIQYYCSITFCVSAPFTLCSINALTLSFFWRRLGHSPSRSCWPVTPTTVGIESTERGTRVVQIVQRRVQREWYRLAIRPLFLFYMKDEKVCLDFVLTSSPRVLLPKPIMLLTGMAGDGTGAHTATILDTNVYHTYHVPV